MAILIGGEGDDILIGSEADDTLNGGAGDDRINGAGGNDKISGGSGNDTLSGDAGNDTLFSGAGDDALFGGSGNDRMVLNGSGNQTYDGGEGEDIYVIDFSSLNLDPSTVIEVNMITGYSGAQHTTALSDMIVNFEHVDLSTATNSVRITGDAGNNALVGGAGNDTLFSGAGDDALFGGAGNDRMVLNGRGSQTYDGGEGEDTYVIDFSSLNLDSSTVIEVNMITGYSGAQHTTALSDMIVNFEHVDLSTATNSVRITGDAGNNALVGGAGNDTINGGDGTDVAIFSGLPSEYNVQEIGKDLIITDNQTGRDGVDSLLSIETLKFFDGVAELSELINPTNIDRGIYRFFNVDTGTHFLSGSTVERDSVINNLDSFNFEGPTFKAADPTNPSADTVFRFFNTQTGTHFFT